MKIRISISLPEKMAIELEKAVKRGNYSSKSELIRKLLIKRIEAEKNSNFLS